MGNDTHVVRFKNLVDVKTSKPVELEVPNGLAYEGGMFAAKAAGAREARRLLACLRSPDPDKMF